jgi:hypothetical protein
MSVGFAVCSAGKADHSVDDRGRAPGSQSVVSEALGTQDKESGARNVVVAATLSAKTSGWTRWRG